ncbi:MAG: recombination mediator RecR [Candidatus Izemoplasmataceae bacterium]
MKYPDSIHQLIESFMRYPGIGKKTAERYAFYTINHFDEEDIIAFMDALQRVKQEIKPCNVCGSLTDQDLCEICKDDKRDKSKILVVEESKDVIVIEKANMYDGMYHVLNGVISPSNGIGPDDISIKSLLNRLKDEVHKEVILATNLSDEGETTAMYIHRLLENTDILVTRIAYGLPAGGNISYADDMTLFKAIDGRKKY